jgi:hypothetical protein
MANGQTILESYAKNVLKFQGIIVYSSLLQLDVTKIEKLVCVLLRCTFYICACV